MEGREREGPQVTVEPGPLRDLLRHCAVVLLCGVDNCKIKIFITVAQTWKDPVSDVVIFIVENPPTSVVSFAYKVRCMFVAIETYLP